MNNKWETIRSRLDAVHLRLEKGFEPDQEKKAGILRARAEELAQTDDNQNDDPGACCEVVEFMLAHETYALELSYIREIYPLKEITPVPCTPEFVMGIINFRGQILSIIDLKKIFGFYSQNLSRSQALRGNRNRVIVLHSEDMEFGILADEVIGTRSVRISEIQSSLTTLTGRMEEYLKGITKERVIILNGEKILSDKSLIVYNQQINRISQSGV